jgi:hypothetical protein
VNGLDRYQAHRPLICTMDMIQWRGPGPAARAIRDVTGESVNHTSCAIRFPSYFASRVFSIEAEFKDGLDVYPLSRILAAYDGQAWCYPVRPAYHGHVVEAACWLLERVGVTGYDTRGCLSHARRILGRDPRPAEASSLYCSESIFLAWRDGAHLPHLQGITHAPVPGRPMEALGIWGDPVRIK